VLLKNLVLKKI